jgi:hypothetical protein
LHTFCYQCKFFLSFLESLTELKLLAFFGVDAEVHHDLLKYPKKAISSGVRNAVILIASLGFPPAFLALEAGALVNTAGALVAGSFLAGEAAARKLNYRSLNSS